MKLEHVAINVQEPAQLAAWLVDNLGMRLVMSQAESPYMHFVADEAGSMIELYNNPAAEKPIYSEVNPFNLHFAFSTVDIVAERQRLLDAGATAVGDVTSTAAGDKLAFLRSPWDEPLQLVQRKKPLI